MSKRTRFVQQGNSVSVIYDYGDGERSRTFVLRGKIFYERFPQEEILCPWLTDGGDVDKAESLVEYVRRHWYRS